MPPGFFILFAFFIYLGKGVNLDRKKRHHHHHHRHHEQKRSIAQEPLIAHVHTPYFHHLLNNVEASEMYHHQGTRRGMRHRSKTIFRRKKN